MAEQAYTVDMHPGDVAFCSDISGKLLPQDEGGHGGWVAAGFVEGVTGLGAAELKVQVHPKGDERPWSETAHGWTHAVCLSGKIRIWFRPEGAPEYFIDLETNQDVSHPNAVPHRWEVLKDDTVVVTVRMKN